MDTIKQKLIKHYRWIFLIAGIAGMFSQSYFIIMFARILLVYASVSIIIKSAEHIKSKSKKSQNYINISYKGKITESDLNLSFTKQ